MSLEVSVWELANCQQTVPVRLELLQDMIPQAISAVERRPPGALAPAWESLRTVEVSIVSDPALASLHEAYLDDPSITDVITFPYGEILVSADTALREALARDIPLEREILLYIIHGLLHLRGYDDIREEERELMHQMQSTILDELWPPQQHSVF